MGYALNKVQTADGYPLDPLGEISGIPIILLSVLFVRLDVIVQNSDVYYQLSKPSAGAAGYWEAAEHYLPLTSGAFTFVSLDRYFHGIRFRSATPGTPAQITVDVLEADEIPQNA